MNARSVFEASVANADGDEVVVDVYSNGSTFLCVSDSEADASAWLALPELRKLRELVNGAVDMAEASQTKWAVPRG